MLQRLSRSQLHATISGCSFHLTPVTILKCRLAKTPQLVGTKTEVSECERLRQRVIPFVMSLGNDLQAGNFANSVRERIMSTLETEGFAGRLVSGYANSLTYRLANGQARDSATRLAEHYAGAVCGWFSGQQGALIQRAIERLQTYGIQPLLPVYGTVEAIGAGICGQYQPALHTVTVQLDVIAKTQQPVYRFLETICHEQVHALILQNLDLDSTSKKRLEGLHEITAITTSHQAIIEAAEDLGMASRLHRICRELRNQQRYGNRAEALLQAAPDPLIAWKVWQDIFALPAEQRAHWYRSSILDAILWERGWPSNVPAG